MDARLRSVPAGDPEGARVEEPQGFETFFEQTRGRLFGALCLVTGNRHEAEEIAQDAFLKVWERWDRVSTLEDPTGFLFRTAMNLFRNPSGRRNRKWVSGVQGEITDLGGRPERACRP